MSARQAFEPLVPTVCIRLRELGGCHLGPGATRLGEILPGSEFLRCANRTGRTGNFDCIEWTARLSPAQKPAFAGSGAGTLVQPRLPVFNNNIAKFSVAQTDITAPASAEMSKIAGCVHPAECGSCVKKTLAITDSPSGRE